MATKTDERSDTTIEISGDGFSTGPIPADEFEDRAGEALDRLRVGQLSFNVGVAGGKPDFASLKITGDLGLAADLKRRQELTVTVTDQNGEVVATHSATVTGVAFKDKTDSHGYTTVERVHTASLD